MLTFGPISLLLLCLKISYILSSFKVSYRLVYLKLSNIKGRVKVSFIFQCD